MKIFGIILGTLACLLGITFIGFLLLVGISPGFGMSEGTRGQFFGGLATGAVIIVVGILLIWFNRHRRDSQPSVPDHRRQDAPRR